MINLTGISRFKILKEVSNKKLYREFQVNYDSFSEDINDTNSQTDSNDLMKMLKSFLKEMVFCLIGKNLKNWIQHKK